MKWIDIRFKPDEQMPETVEMFNLETAKYIGLQYIDTDPVWTIRYNNNIDDKQINQNEYIFYVGYYWPAELVDEYTIDLQKLISAFLRSSEQMLVIHMDEPALFKTKLKLLQEKEEYLPS